MAYSSRRSLSRSALSLPSSSSTSVDSKGREASPRLHSPSRSLSDQSNIFVQMNQFSKLESPSRNELSLSAATVASPTRAHGSVSTSAISISSLRSVLSLPMNVRQSTSTTKVDLADGKHGASATDDNKNCIPASPENIGIDYADDTVEVPAKRRNLSELNDNDVCDRYKQKYCMDRMSTLRLLHGSYQDDLTELFFLQNGGNLMDYFSWKKRPNTLLACYLRSESIDEDIDGSLFLVSIKFFGMFYLFGATLLQCI